MTDLARSLGKPSAYCLLLFFIFINFAYGDKSNNGFDIIPIEQQYDDIQKILDKEKSTLEQLKYRKELQNYST